MSVQQISESANIPHPRNSNIFFVLSENRGLGRTPVNWSTRIKLASDAATGLTLLHHHTQPKLFHGHVTSSNILTDGHGTTALISDTALSLLFPPPPSEQEHNQAPELHVSSKYTQKCDVYSFGVVLLEILTGKTADGEGETGLVRWIRHVCRADWSPKEVFDFELLQEGKKKVEEEMKSVLQLALLCLSPSPRDRPRMRDVWKMIEGVRKNGGVKGNNLFKSKHLSDESSSSSSF